MDRVCRQITNKVQIDSVQAAKVQKVVAQWRFGTGQIEVCVCIYFVST